MRTTAPNNPIIIVAGKTGDGNSGTYTIGESVITVVDPSRRFKKVLTIFTDDSICTGAESNNSSDNVTGARNH
jgi:hypothetical protein